ncbi:hypothetical protein ONE63_001038 [Megalurothrips usitatus]|uniref:Uncharacterized protein n=1 Tax=Megalurothrips usitatus TaxID=439358 RepID=A0AAV7XH62_9NEOP|nr:hypothetical protein ONE63_001038 [Megalurothrips usitatus]
MGQLLSCISVGWPNGEIESVAQLVASNLSILLPPDQYGSGRDVLPPAVRARTAVYQVAQLDDLLEAAAQERASAVVIGEEWLPRLSAYQRPPASLHAFRLPLAYVKTLFASSPGSPLESALRKVLGRLQARATAREKNISSINEFKKH